MTDGLIDSAANVQHEGLTGFFLLPFEPFFFFANFLRLFQVCFNLLGLGRAVGRGGSAIPEGWASSVVPFPVPLEVETF